MAPSDTKQQMVSVLEEVFDMEAMPEPSPDVDLKELQSKLSEIPKDSDSSSIYPCITQSSLPSTFQNGSKGGRIWLGWNNEVPRWRKGSIINWSFNMNGWPSAQHADFAIAHMDLACSTWNQKDLGFQFRYVQTIEDSAFVVTYGGWKYNVLAEAFFPNANDLNSVIIYSASFAQNSVGSLWNICQHELGHVIGLRHEFAAAEGQAVQFGSANPNSVMSYKFPPAIQDSDINSTRDFYNYTGTSIGQYAIKDYDPNN